jgi:hypothetical protein
MAALKVVLKVHRRAVLRVVRMAGYWVVLWVALMAV